MLYSPIINNFLVKGATYEVSIFPGSVWESEAGQVYPLSIYVPLQANYRLKEALARATPELVQ